jgi:hypothetical protein
MLNKCNLNYIDDKQKKQHNTNNTNTNTTSRQKQTKREKKVNITIVVIGLLSNIGIHIEVVEQLGIAERLIREKTRTIWGHMQTGMHIDQANLVRVRLELSVQVVDERAIAVGIDEVAQLHLNELVRLLGHGGRWPISTAAARVQRRLVVVEIVVVAATSASARAVSGRLNVTEFRRRRRLSHVLQIVVVVESICYFVVAVFAHF